MEKKKLETRNLIIIASTLFGMFFGAGNLIFPVHLGQLAGRNFLAAAVGFIVTGVGIPILGVAAIGCIHSEGLFDLSSKLGKRYGYFFTILLYLAIGPFFAIPRCATTSFSTGFAPLLGNMNEKLALLLFSACFFAVVLALSLKPGSITVWIGRIINPVFLFCLFLLVVFSLVRPGAQAATVVPDPSYEAGAFFNGFLEGYNTMDAIAGLAFGIVVINIIRSMGVTDDSAIASNVLKSGCMTGVLMAVIYLLTVLMGAQSRGFFEVSENGGVALAQISHHYFGSAGSVVLAATITLACLKTAIGLVTSCSETFVTMFPNKLSYKAWAVVFTVFSFAVSNVGLTSIIKLAIPALMFIYPLTITLIILALCGNLFHHNRTVYRCTTAFTMVAAVFDFIGALPSAAIEAMHLQGILGFAASVLPFSNLGLGWVVPAAVGCVLGLILAKVRK